MQKILALVLMVAWASCAAFAAVPDIDWTEYVFGDDGFAVATPDAPSAVQGMVETAYGAVESHFYSVAVTEDAGFMVIVTVQHNDDDRTPAEVLSDTQKHGVEGLKGNLLGQQPITVDKRAGVQIEFQSDQFQGRIRYVVVGRRSYQLVSLAALGKSISGDTERFYNSFRLLGDP